MKLNPLIILYLILICSCTEEDKRNLDGGGGTKEYNPIDKEDHSKPLENSGEEGWVKEGIDSWKKMDTLSHGAKISMIKSLEEQFPHLSTYEGWEKKNLNTFHFIDLDKDGDNDLVFDGWSGGEPECVRIFLCKKGSFEMVFDQFQFVNGWQYDKSGLEEISIQDPGCCLSYITFDKDYTVSGLKDSLNFELKHKSATINLTEYPNSYFKDPIRFIVTQEKYYLRAAPRIAKVDLQIEGGEKCQSNILATLEEGTVGIAIAEATDKTGRIWWFVEMEEGYIPTNSHFYGLEEEKAGIRGWISSKYVERIN